MTDSATLTTPGAGNGSLGNLKLEMVLGDGSTIFSSVIGG